MPVLVDGGYSDESFIESDDAFESGDESDMEYDENVAPPNLKSKPEGGAPSKKSTTVLKEKKTDDNVSAPSTNEKPGKKGKTVEQIYQKKSQLEHILLRPDTYIGSVERITQQMYVLDSERSKIVEREVTFTPGLYKIFDEIVVNAADNKQRDPSMDKLDIVIDPENNCISVKNNGRGIPIVVHKEHNCYVPTLIFGHLLTGSNFDDDEKKTTGGRNGYGAKLANIFSTEFVIECVDAANGIKFKQVFKNNMSQAGEPTVNKCTAREKKQGDSTKITFFPDLPRFKMEELDRDAVSLLSRRAYDVAGTLASRSGKRLTVTLNGKKLPIKSFKDYLNQFEGIQAPSAYEKVGDRWEVGVGVSEGSFQHISFVNAIFTSKGGGHVTFIADQVAASLSKTIKKKNKSGTDVKPNQIKNHLSVFVNCLIENPAFDSQTKDFLTTRPKAFGSECKLSDKFLKQVDKSGVVDSILSFARFKQGQALKRQGGVKKSKLTGIAKLDDANFAGTAKSKDCTLIITEGDSAKSLAMSGLSVVGRDYYGVFPLKGKPLNVREASHSQIVANEEIKNLVDILGLKFGTAYTEQNIKSLRYGHLMIMADQDHDGSHIKGLVINFIHHFWPSLLDVPGFLQQFITPIVKATKGKICHTFFTLPEFEAWKESMGDEAKRFKVKYYKGLGTSTAAEAKEYFSNLDLHEVHFAEMSTDTAIKQEDSSDDMDVEVVPDKMVSGSDLIDMCFSKSRVEDRKTWLNVIEKDIFLDYSQAQESGVAFSDFVNKELVLFSRADNQRSIPHVMDGLKPSQRKVLFSCFKRKLKNEIKVAQLAGYVSEHSAYHHGEASLSGTIIGMAQSFCGSNNVNLLTPSGQFGTRRMGGKDAASPRYTFTKLEPITRKIFHPDDDPLLSYLNDDGLSIEPEFYMPVIPMILVNGTEGIGTGWSTCVPNFNPRVIIMNIRRMLEGKEPEKMNPFYNGYTGTILSEPSKRVGYFSVTGSIERVDETTLHISELPIKKWTQDYKLFLEGMLNGDAKKAEPELKDFKENHTDTTVSFTITASKEKIDAFEREKNGLNGKFKLTGSLSTSNMNLFDQEGHIMKYGTPEAMLTDFFRLRLEYYEKRKELLLRKLRREQKMLRNKARFVEEVCSGDLVVSNRKKVDILDDLQERGYDQFEKDPALTVASNQSEEEDQEKEEAASETSLARGYDYLLGMKIWSLTFERAEELRAQLREKTKNVTDLEATAPSKIWSNDLDAIDEALDERDEEIRAAIAEEAAAQSKSTRERSTKTQTKRRKPPAKMTQPSTTARKQAASQKKRQVQTTLTLKTKKAIKSEKRRDEDEMDCEGDVGSSLADRVSAGLQVSESTKSSEADNSTNSSSEDSLDDEIKKLATSKTRVVKKKPAAPKRARATAASKSKRPSKRQVTVSSESEDSIDYSDAESPPVIHQPLPSRTTGRKAARVNYKMESSDESDSDSEVYDTE